MFPEICKIGPFTIFSYGLMLALAFIVGTALASAKAKEENIHPDTIFNLAFISFISGIIGARLFYISYNLDYFLTRPLEIIMLQHGGLSWFGGLILGIVAGVIYLRSKKLKIYRALDLLAPFVALAQAIGRIGCLLNGCCYGRESNFGIYFPVHNAVLIPTQLYSSLLLILIFIILRFLQDRQHKEGQIFTVYLILYSTKRFFIEFFRADSPTVFFGLTLFQIVSLAVLLMAILNLTVIYKSKRPRPS